MCSLYIVGFYENLTERPHRLAARTQASQAWNRGSIPREVTNAHLRRGSRSPSGSAPSA